MINQYVVVEPGSTSYHGTYRSPEILFGPVGEAAALTFAKDAAYDRKAPVEVYKLIQTHHVKPPLGAIVEEVK